MIEAMLWTMADPLLAEQLPKTHQPVDRSAVYRCEGEDAWAGVEPAPDVPPNHATSVAALTQAGIAASMLARSADLVASEHLRARGFWNGQGLPGLPWRASFGFATGQAPRLGADTDSVLRQVLGMSTASIAELRASGALG